MFILLLSLLSTASASDDSVDYTNLKKGEVAQFDGKLFTNEAVAKILSNHEAEKEKIKIEADYQLQKTVNDLNLKYSILETKRNSEIKMYQTMIQVRDEQIKNTGRKDVLRKWATYGGFVLGAASSIAIFYSVSHN